MTSIPKGLGDDVVKLISDLKNEPAWVRDFRARALSIFHKKDFPKWGPDLSALDFSDFTYYVKPLQGEVKNWKDVDPEIEKTFERLGIPKAEQEVLAGVKTQFESDIVYGSLKQSLKEQGVIFCSMEEAIREHGDLVKQYLGTVVPSGDNKFSALNSVFFSGGSFLYVPCGVVVNQPLQTYFRINTAKTGQFERTLIVAEAGSKVHYIEGCTAPNFSSANLHAAVVEVIVKEEAQVVYTTIQNWSKNVYNLVTKRAVVEKNAKMAWTDANLGSKVTMKYPSCLLVGENASGAMLSLAIAGSGQTIDSGAKMLHLAPNTKSSILSKSLSLKSGQTSFRGLVQINELATNSIAKVSCQALLIDNDSRNDTYPTLVNSCETATIEHEAFVSKLAADQLFYLQSRGIPEPEAASMLVLGFLEPVLAGIPLEYTVELNSLLEMAMEGYYGN